MKLIKGNIKIQWENIGEGYNGDYNPEDPTDENLLRFYVSVRKCGMWIEKDGVSRCTLFPASASEELKMKALEYLMNHFYPALKDDSEANVKHLADTLSHISLDYVS